MSAACCSSPEAMNTADIGASRSTRPRRSRNDQQTEPERSATRQEQHVVVVVRVVERRATAGLPVHGDGGLAAERVTDQRGCQNLCIPTCQSASRAVLLFLLPTLEK